MTRSSLPLLALAVAALGVPAAARDVRLVRAFPDHPRLDRPLLFVAAPGSDGEHVVAEQRGVVHAVRIDPDGGGGELRRILDLSRSVGRRGNEEGFLGLAFHPRFAENGLVYVHYTVRGERRNRISELRGPTDLSGPIDRGSERVLLEVDQPYSNHNGGQLAFGPDGMLYVGLGDGGSAGDPRQNAQDLGTLLGSILRIDVDERTRELAYGIPSDNPFVDREGARGEIWAFGLRNPWRFSFDPETGRLWVGDVGQNRYEEIDVVEKGDNHGWRVMEARAVFDADAERGPGELVEPVVRYGRHDGKSVTGGFVYRGSRVPALEGRYVYGDYESGRLWAIEADPEAPGEPVELGECHRPASFGVDARGELYVCSFDGWLYRFTSGGTDG